jgi:transposase
MNQKSTSKLAIRDRRIFSESLKRQVVKELVSGRTTIKSIMAEHQVSSASVYRWLYRYSSNHQSKCTLVVQMESEETKKRELQHRIAELERIVGQKQLEIDFLNRLIEIGSKELEFDFKKNFSPKLSSGSVGENNRTNT